MSQTPVGRPELEAARLLLERMGISPADLLDLRPSRPAAPTFAEYVRSARSTCSTNVRAGHVSSWQRQRQTGSWISTRRPLIARSASTRTYRLCRAVDRCPQRGHRAEPAALAATIRTRVAEVSTASTTTPDRYGTSSSSPAITGEDSHSEPNDDQPPSVVTESEPEPIFGRR